MDNPSGKRNLRTQIEYLYRDADNYKQGNCCVIDGILTTAQQQEIIDCLEDGEYFIPRLVGLPEKKFEEETEADHPYFEMNMCAFSLTPLDATVDITAEELVERFRRCKNKWEIGADIVSDTAPTVCETVCKHCGAVFTLSWDKKQKNIFPPDFCPFCGRFLWALHMV